MRKKARQAEFGFVNWGGKRRGAGRKPKGERAGVPHAKRPKLASRFPVLVTMRLCEGLPSLRADDSHELIRDAFVEGSGEEFRVIEYSVQSNHLHILAESRDEHALTRGMIGVAVRIARGLNRVWKRSGRVFADRFHARILQTPRAVRTALVYCLQNGRKHGAWRARTPDAYSSGVSFEGWKDGNGKGAESRPRLLARARAWLLSIGWKRHGLIDPREVPLGSCG
jgi:putative transposase